MPARTLFSVNPQKLSHVYPPDSRANATKPVEMGASLTWAKGQILGQKTSDKKHYLYNDANSDGTEVAQVIAAYAGSSDANGLIFLGDSVPLTGPASYADTTLETYYGGTFKVSELVGLNAAAIADFRARLLDAGETLLIPT